MADAIRELVITSLQQCRLVTPLTLSDLQPGLALAGQPSEARVPGRWRESWRIERPAIEGRFVKPSMRSSGQCKIGQGPSEEPAPARRLGRKHPGPSRETAAEITPGDLLKSWGPLANTFRTLTLAPGKSGISGELAVHLGSA